MSLQDVIQQGIVLWVDFNSLEDDDLLPTTLRYATGPRKPTEGEWVRIMDSDGNSCWARVLRIEGMTVEVRPEWSTWISPVMTEAFSGWTSPEDTHPGGSWVPPTPMVGEHTPDSAFQTTAR